VQLAGVVPDDAAAVFGKLEWFNPTGSYKDRMALAMTGVRGGSHTHRERCATEMGPGQTVVIVACGTGLKYFAGDLYT
jgi:cysteine synthase